MRKRPVQGVEEDQIARQQPAPVDRSAELRDVGGATADAQACRPFEDVGHHAAAVEPGLGILAAEAVAGVDQGHRVDRDLAPALRGNALRWRWWHAAAGGEQDDHRGGGDKTDEASALHGSKYKLPFLPTDFPELLP